MKVPLQVPAGARSPTRSSSRRTAPLRAATPEYELLDTGVFDDNRYFDVFVEYAKADVERHPDPHHGRESRAGGGRAAPPADDLVSQHLVVVSSGVTRPYAASASRRHGVRHAGSHRRTALRHAATSYCDGEPELLFTENETNYAAPLRDAQRHAVRQGRHQRPTSSTATQRR